MATKKPEVIDLFSGCGGLALGFMSEGFHITHGVELMEKACETVSYNMHWRYGEESEHICGDITQMDPSIWKDSIGKNGCIVIGGPPCQAYSLAGRAKLASLGEDRSNLNDRRGYLYQDFLRFVYGLDAEAVIMENVPESTDFGGSNIPEIVSESLENHGYNVWWTILNSADFGVPQVRERVILTAIKKKYGKEINLPVPEYHNPQKTLTPNQQRFGRLSGCRHFRIPRKPGRKTEEWITVGEALSDLPVLFRNSKQEYHLNKIMEPFEYRCEPQNSFQQKMRTWYGTETEFVTGNCFRCTVRDFPIFERMEQGANFLDASRIADEILQQKCAERHITPNDGKEYELLKEKTVPPYSRDKFIAKWQKLRTDKPSHTLVAHLSVDTYSHIHPIEPRGISVREAARLQSFPDDFLFQCSMGDAFKQIGNAVPPLMAKAVARQVRLALRKSRKTGEIDD